MKQISIKVGDIFQNKTINDKYFCKFFVVLEIMPTATWDFYIKLFDLKEKVIFIWMYSFIKKKYIHVK